MTQLRESKGSPQGGQFARDTRGSRPAPSGPIVPGATRTLVSAPPANYTDVHARFAGITSGPAWVLRQNQAKQLEIVNDDEVSETLLYTLAADQHTEPEVLVAIARKTNDPETLRVLSRKPYTAVVCWATWNDNLPAEELPRLAGHRDVNIRQGVTEHRDLPKATALALGSKAKERDPYVRQGAKDHANYPKKAERLAMVAARGQTQEVLYILAGDSLPQVANRAKSRLARMGVVVPDFEADAE